MSIPSNYVGTLCKDCEVFKLSPDFDGSLLDLLVDRYYVVELIDKGCGNCNNIRE